MVQRNASFCLQWTCGVLAKILSAGELMWGLDGRLKVKLLFRRNKAPWIRVSKAEKWRFVFCTFFCSCSRPSFCQVLWRRPAVSLEWKRGLLEEWCIGSFCCGSRQAGFGKEGFCDLFFFLFPWFSLSLQIQYGLIYLSELLSLVYYLSTEKVQLKLPQV